MWWVLFIAFVFGVVVNAIVIAALAIYRPHIGPNGTARQAWTSDDEPRWHLRRIDYPGMTRLYWTVDGNTLSGPTPGATPITPALAPAWSRVGERAPASSDVGRVELLIEVAFGWPWPAASYEYRRLGTGWMDPRTPVAGGWDLGDKGRVPLTIGPPGRNEVCAVPWRIAWSGFLANTALFASVMAACVLALRWLGPRVFVREARRRAGLCIWCGYARTGLGGERCPECGREAAGAEAT